MRALWLAALFLFASAASARPYTVDDMLQLESYGQVQVDPSERWAIVERRARYDSAPRFDYGAMVERSLSRLMVLDLENPGQLRPLFEQEPDAGYWSAGFSPSGQRLAIYRLQGNRLSLGVLDMIGRTVRWLPMPATILWFNPRPLWVDNDTMIYVARPDGRLPSFLGGGAFSPRNMRSQWSRQAAGTTSSVVVIGSGDYRDQGLANDALWVVRVDLRTGASETLERASVSDIAISADRRRLAIVRRDTAFQPEPDIPIDPAALGRRQRLVIRDLETGDRREICSTCDLLPNLLSWSPEGAELLYFARQDGQAWSDGQLYRLVAGSPRPVALPGARPEVRVVGGSGYALIAGWAGSDPIISARTQQGQSIWFRVRPSGAVRISDSGPTSLIGASQHYLYFNSGAGIRRVDENGISTVILRDPIQSVGVELLDPYSTGPRNVYNRDLAGPVLVTASDGSLHRAVQIDPAAGISWFAPLPALDARVLAVANRRRALLYSRVNPDGIGTLTLAGADVPPVDVDIVNRHLTGVDESDRIAIHSVAPDGARLTHWLTLPRDTDRMPPLVVIPYPGLVQPDGPPTPLRRAAMRPMVNPALLVAAGFAVLEPSVPRYRPEGDFAAGVINLRPEARGPRDHDDPIGRMTEIVLGAVDAAAATGRVNAGRAALYGHSFGGWAVVSIATRTDRFKAVIAANGPYDLLAAYGRLVPATELDEQGIAQLAPYGWFESGQGALGGPPWRDFQTYLTSSPLYAVERIRTPVMLIHGDQDVVAYSGAERMFMALYRVNRDAVLLRYDGEEHSPHSPANIRDQWRRTLEFLRAHLGMSTESSEPPVSRP